MSRRTAGLLLLPLSIGLALRLAYAVACGGVYHVSGDGEEGYYETSLSLLSSRSLSQGAPATEPSAFRGPLYPSFIAAVDGPFGRSRPGRVRLAQAVLHGLGIALVFGLACFAATPFAGFLAASWLALQPSLIAVPASLNVHGFYGLVMAAVAASAALWAESATLGATLALGAALAASLLCRSAHFPLPAFLLAAAAWWARREKRPWRRPALLLGALLVFLSPMVARNAWHFRRFILLDSYKASYLALQSTAGAYVNTTVDQALDTAEQLEPGFRARGLAERPLYEALLRLAVRNALAHPVRYAGYCLLRFARFWKGMAAAGLLALYGAWALRREKRYWALFLSAASFIGYSFAGGLEEYRVSVLPVLYAAAGCGLAELLVRLGLRPPKPWTTPARDEARALLRGGRAALLALYAVALLFLARECATYGLARDVTASRGPGLIDARLVDGLKPPALAEPPSGEHAEIYANVLVQYAQSLREKGDRAGEAAALHEAGLWAGLRVRSLEGAYRRDGAPRRAALARARLNRARLRARAGQDAGEDLRRALELDPGSRPAALLYAVEQERAGRDAEALRLLALDPASLAKLPPSLRAHWLLARSLAQSALRRPGPAAADLDAALASDAEAACVDAPELGDRRRAPASYFDACLRRYPEDARLLVDRGVARWFAGEKPAAVADFRHALEKHPDSLEAALSLATVLAGEKKGGEAAAVLDGALSAAPARESTLRSRALALRREVTTDNH